MANRNPVTKWTLVRHTGWSVNGNPQFHDAVEVQCVYTAKEFGNIIASGGILFDDYTEASEREHAENYPPEVQGLIPHVRGSFVRRAGLDIYVPMADMLNQPQTNAEA